jgi:hypothetical protein
MRRRALVGSRPAGVLEALALFHVDKGEPDSFERHEVDLADRGRVGPCDDAVTPWNKP